MEGTSEVVVGTKPDVDGAPNGVPSGKRQREGELLLVPMESVSKVPRLEGDDAAAAKSTVLDGSTERWATRPVVTENKEPGGCGGGGGCEESDRGKVDNSNDKKTSKLEHHDLRQIGRDNCNSRGRKSSPRSSRTHNDASRKGTDHRRERSPSRSSNRDRNESRVRGRLRSGSTDRIRGRRSRSSERNPNKSRERMGKNGRRSPSFTRGRDSGRNQRDPHHPPARASQPTRARLSPSRRPTQSRSPNRYHQAGNNNKDRSFSNGGRDRGQDYLPSSGHSQGSRNSSTPYRSRDSAPGKFQGRGDVNRDLRAPINRFDKGDSRSRSGPVVHSREEFGQDVFAKSKPTESKNSDISVKNSNHVSEKTSDAGILATNMEFVSRKKDITGEVGLQSKDACDTKNSSDSDSSSLEEDEEDLSVEKWVRSAPAELYYERNESG
jgi:hypothetical protein